MPAKDLGTKHTCFKCETKFYDLKKAVAICPKCGADQRESPALKPAPASERKSRAAAKPPPPPPPAEEADDAELVDVEADEDLAEEDEDDADA